MTQTQQGNTASAKELQHIPIEINQKDQGNLLTTDCIHHIVEAYAQQQPQAIAVSDAKESLTYRELNAQANQIARYLQRIGNTPEQPVGIYMDQSVKAVVSMLGVLKAGSAYVPIETRYPISRVSTILEEAGITNVLSQKSVGQKLAGTMYQVINVPEDWSLLAVESQEDLPHGHSTDRDLAYIIYTSGTTGKPKGVEIEHRNLRNLIRWHQQAFQITAHDKATLFASISFDASVWELWPYLCSGASVHVIPNEIHESLTDLQKWIVEKAITVCFLPTPLAEQIVTLEWPTPLPLRILLTGGDRLHIYPPATLPFTFVNNYGPTENTVVATSGIVTPLATNTEDLPSIGKPITNVELFILDDQLQVVPPGSIGELYIAGASLARGYRNQPQLTKERFLSHPFSTDPQARLYKTGDLAQWNNDGTITFLGRNDEQVKIRGFRIELSEIQLRLASYEAIQESCVIAVPDGAHGNLLAAFFVPKESRQVALETLQDYLKATLPDYMIPAKLTQLKKLPLTISGKIDQKQLAALVNQQEEEQLEIVTDNPVEEGLLTIWRDLLKGFRFGLHDDFFKIGGHSLSVLQLIVRIKKAFGVNVTVRDIFQNPTITKLAVIVQNKQPAQKGS